MANKARVREQKIKQKEKNIELKRVDAVIASKSKANHHERHEEITV